jgi:hypothetical protein
VPTYIQKSSTELQSVPGTDAILEKTNTSELGIVLDQSGSMSSLINEAIAGFNALVDEQQNLEVRPANFSLELFNDSLKMFYDAVQITEVRHLTSEFYKPIGGTALNDAIGAMIQAIGRRARHRTRVLIAILTDGEENVSRNFSTPDIRQMIAYRRTAYNWQFIFIGPPEAERYALSLGIPKSNIVSLRADGAGITAIMGRLSLSMRAYQLGDRRYALKLHNS